MTARRTPRPSTTLWPIGELEKGNYDDDPTATPRPPDGDWLGTRFLRFRREGPFAVCTLDRPEARNAMTPAMYFGIKYAVGHVEADPDLAGLLITGTGDVFAPGGDMRRWRRRQLADVRRRARAWTSRRSRSCASRPSRWCPR